MNPLPVFTTVLLALAALQQNWRSLLVALVMPAACILIVETATAGILTKGFAYAFIAWALGAPFYALFAVVVHRTVILGSDSLPNPIGMFWSAREIRFVGWTIALFLLTLVLAFLIGALTALFAQLIPRGPASLPLSTVTLTVIWLTVAYIYTRLSVLFPATAVDDDTSFERAWQLTDSNGFRMIAIIIFTVGPVSIVSLGITYLLPAGILTTTLDALLSFIVMLVGICAVSVTYRQLIRIEHEQYGDSPRNPTSDAADEPPRNPFDG